MLGEPFPVNEVKFLPKVVNQGQALAIGYLDARSILDRLDEAVGPENWSDSYEMLPGGSVRCTLSIRVNGEWVSKSDVGSPSEQPDAGDKVKAGHSDALKRAAVKWGVGRYLYRLPAVWCPYDAVKKRFTQTPQLPDWAKPNPAAVQVRQTNGQALPPSQPPKKLPPQTGTELHQRLRALDEKLAEQKICQLGELMSKAVGWAVKAGWPDDLHKLDARGIKYITEMTAEWVKDRQQAKPIEQGQTAPPPANTPKPPADEKSAPHGAAGAVRHGLLTELWQRGQFIEREYKEPLDTWLSREVHHGLTFEQIETNPHNWDDKAVSAITEQLKRYIDGGIPH